MSTEPGSHEPAEEPSASSAKRLVLVGGALVGLCSVVVLTAQATGAGLILIAGAVVGAFVVLWGRPSIGVNGSAALVLTAAAIVGVLALLDLLAVVTDLSNLSLYGGILGLLARGGCTAGAAFMLVGANRGWKLSQPVAGAVDLEKPERLAALGGSMVVGAWVLMITSVWTMSVDQAIGVAAATSITAVVWLNSRKTLPVSSMGRRVLLLSLTVVGLGMAMVSLVNTLGDWGFLLEMGGVWVLLSYLVYLGGAAVLLVAGVMEAQAVRDSSHDLRLDHLAMAGLTTVLTFVVALAGIAGGDDGEPARSAGEPTVTTADADQGVVTGDTLPLGPEVPPIDACALLTDVEVEQALGISAADSQGLLVFSGQEGCSWQPQFEDGSREDLFVAVGPGDQNDFEEGAQRNGTVAMPVSDFGAAVWFGGPDRGVLSVIEPTDIAYALVIIQLASPELEDLERLERAKVLAASVLESLQGEGPATLEADLCDLVTDEEAEEILAPLREGRPAARRELHVIGPSAPVDLTQTGDSGCQKLILTEIYVEVALGDPSDFEPGAALEGIPGEPIQGVGDEAMWFASVPMQRSFSSPHEAGVLAVRRGDARFRVLLSLPDLEVADQLETAKRLASSALIRMIDGDATVITIDHSPPDFSGRDFLGNLLAREERGDWTRAEGLVATLELILGEAEVANVLLEPELQSYEATGVVNLARRYLADNPDSAAAGELTRLLGMILFTDEQLEAMAGVGPPTASLPWFWSVEAAAEPTEDCKTFFSGWEIPAGIGACLEKRSAPELDGYKVFGPAPPLPMAGWKEHHFDWALQALKDIVPHYKTLGKLPPVNIVLSVANHPKAVAVAAPRLDPEQNRPCGVTLFRNMQTETVADFKQIVAHELAHCLHGDTFSSQYTAGPEKKWWDEGLAEYLSNTVNEEYATNDLEIRDNLDEFNSVELSTTLLDRAYDNFIFFQQLAHFYGNEGIFALISKLPSDGGTRAEQEKALAGYRDLDDKYHEFVENVTDINIEDTGGGIVATIPDSDSHTLAGRTIVFDEPRPFGVTRLALAVPDDLYACIELDKSSDVQLSWREGRPAVPSGTWSNDLPDVLTGEAVVVVTTAKPNGQLTIDVTDVSDDPECEEDEEVEDRAFECLDLCGISDYYRYPGGLTEWVETMLPPLPLP